MKDKNDKNDKKDKRKCITNFVSSRRKPNIDSFKLPGIFEPEDGSSGTISCRQMILNGPIREKNMFPEIRNFFALMT